MEKKIRYLHLCVSVFTCWPEVCHQGGYSWTGIWASELLYFECALLAQLLALKERVKLVYWFSAISVFLSFFLSFLMHFTKTQNDEVKTQYSTLLFFPETHTFTCNPNTLKLVCLLLYFSGDYIYILQQINCHKWKNWVWINGFFSESKTQHDQDWKIPPWKNSINQINSWMNDSN